MERLAMIPSGPLASTKVGHPPNLAALNRPSSRCCDTLIGFKSICIALVAKVIVFPMLQLPHDVAMIFWTCQLHTAWEFLHENGGSECPAAWHAFVSQSLTDPV